MVTIGQVLFCVGKYGFLTLKEAWFSGKKIVHLRGLNSSAISIFKRCKCKDLYMYFLSLKILLSLNLSTIPS
jgi:hypothetical protein